MYSTFLTASPGSVLFSRSNLLKRKDLCFSCLRLGLISHRRSLRSSHLFSSGLTRFCRVTTREADILVNISIGIQIVLLPRTVFCDWLAKKKLRDTHTFRISNYIKLFDFRPCTFEKDLLQLKIFGHKFCLLPRLFYDSREDPEG
jgi:hypothetical protein